MSSLSVARVGDPNGMRAGAIGGGITGKVVVPNDQSLPFHETCFNQATRSLAALSLRDHISPQRPLPTVQGGRAGLNRKKR
jgi:hypothetical protein